ncbi:uncharacterized protein I303_100261 [Kwoniella dejecticola CBS 10117]|uniref:Kinetochore protein Spc24 n=1 Tax=Kwoniella dejecticola CBS 10117 TaxID=1296121 RepID=A0A1A6AEF4_9TREE|nr:uncharacterized protein I303_00262 [Kwoniella dejecticola CBS 10117]OBR88445.1 hypothetical protein I303_00262 [Kwoniella dejecticola CBS 10117]
MSTFAAVPAQFRQSASPERSFSEVNQSQEFSEDQWRALAKIVRDVGPTLSPDEELGDLAAAEAAVNAKDYERGVIVDKLRDELRELTRQFEQASSAAQRPPSHPSAAEHDAQVRSLEHQQVSTAKQLNEEQSLVSKRELELGKLKNEKEELDSIQVGENKENDDEWLNGKVIRLKMLSDAGFTFVPSKDGKSANKILIRNDLKNDVHSVPLDSSRSKVYTANYIWNLASEGC